MFAVEINLQDLLPRVAAAFPFLAGAVLSFVVAFKRLHNFMLTDYKKNSGQKLRDNLSASFFLGVFVGSLMAAPFAYDSAALSGAELVVFVCFSVLTFPISVLVAYWRYHLLNMN